MSASMLALQPPPKPLGLADVLLRRAASKELRCMISCSAWRQRACLATFPAFKYHKRYSNSHIKLSGGSSTTAQELNVLPVAARADVQTCQPHLLLHQCLVGGQQAC